MAIFRILTNLDWSSYGDMAGATVGLTTATSFTYTSKTGFLVTVTGMGFTYDGLGIPTDGTIAEIKVDKAAVHYADYTQLDYALTAFNTHVFGSISGSPNKVPVDLTGLFIGMRAGDDAIYGTSTSKEMSGYAGNDSIYGGAGNDTLIGGEGRDLFVGGNGTDIVSFVGAVHGAVADLSLTTKGISDDGFGNSETMRSIEGLYGTVFGDMFTGGSANELLVGDFGADTLSGGGGNDTVDGGSSDDLLSGGAGNDVLIGHSGLDTLTGGAGTDAFTFADITPTLGMDTITDMAQGVDKIRISSTWSSHLSGAALTAEQFRSGAGAVEAHTAQQLLIYDTATGDLYFDADGNGSVRSAVLFAHLSNIADLSFQDFGIF